MKVSVIGHFGEGVNLLNGQTIKTKFIFDELQKQLGKDQLLKIDTHGGFKMLFWAPFQVVNALKGSKNVIILPAQNGLRVNVPLLALGRPFFRGRKLHYIVIGGWLPDFLRKRKWLSSLLKTFDGIYVETNSMKRALETQGFNNVFVMPNCKDLQVLPQEQLVYTNHVPFRLCTFSRVMKEKGIEDAVDAVRAANEMLGENAFTLDIYGQVDTAQTAWFQTLQEHFPEYVSYKGCVDANKSVEVLKDYFALLFPTYYEGEGFAGTLLDAMASGVPVIASDWRYNKQLVFANQTGVLFPAKDVAALTEQLICAVNNKEQWNAMRKGCLVEAQKYQPNQVVQVLFEQIDKE